MDIQENLKTWCEFYCRTFKDIERSAKPQYVEAEVRYAIDLSKSDKKIVGEGVINEQI